MKKIMLSILVVFSALALQGKAKVVNDTLYSKVLNAKRAYTVILPSSYKSNPDKQYPVLYLLHGMYDNNVSWTNKADAHMESDRLFKSFLASEMIIVTPDAGGYDPVTEQNGYFDIPGWPYEKFFFEEFMPFIEKTYRIIGDKEHRAIAGLSMGGGGTVSYAQRHSDKFCAAYAMSAWVSLTDEQRKDPTAFAGKIVPLHLSIIKNDCIEYVKNADEKTVEELKSVLWYIDCGDDDFLLDRNLEFYQAMRAKGIPCQLRVRDGGHTWEYWHTALSTCIPFVSNTFAK